MTPTCPVCSTPACRHWDHLDPWTHHPGIPSGVSVASAPVDDPDLETKLDAAGALWRGWRKLWVKS